MSPQAAGTLIFFVIAAIYCPGEASAPNVIYGSAQPPANSSNVIETPYITLATAASGARQADGIVVPEVSYGLPAAPGDFPYIGHMDIVIGYDVFGSPRTAYCGCTLIGPRVALTAGMPCR